MLIHWRVIMGRYKKEQAEFENQKSTISIPHTVAHYTSPQANAVSSSKEHVDEVMKSFGMNVIPVCCDQVAEEEGVGVLGLILEHEIDNESEEFKKLVDEIKLSLHQLGWNYDGWVGEDVEQAMVH